MKKKILFGVEPFRLGDTTRMIEIAKLCQEEFNLAFYGYGGQFVHLIEEAGFTFYKLKPWLTEEKIEQAMKVERGETFEDLFTFNELTERVKNEIAFYKEIQPTAIICHHLPSPLISARAYSVPLVYVCPFAWTRPFFEANLASWPDIFDTRLSFFRCLPKSFRDWFTNQLGLRTNIFTKPFDNAAKAFGTKRFKKLTDLFEGDYTLVTDIPDLTGVGSLPDKWYYVGPIFAKLKVEIPKTILNLPKDKPIIYFSMGSSGNRVIIKEILESFSQMPYRVISPMKLRLQEMDVKVPDNVLLVDWIPAHKVNPLADLAVIHGGQGTVQTACVSGTPIVGIGMQPEQEKNIDFIVQKGAGIRLKKNEFTAKSLQNTIEEILANSQARQKAKEIQEILQAWDGPANVAKFISEKFRG
ncbi:MAG TPA: nucleotide disphospho-sugar-binding domain-containing protein [Leptolyngbyaceae cyanobacterium]